MALTEPIERRIKNAEWHFNFKIRDIEIQKLIKFKKYFLKLQKEAVESLRKGNPRPISDDPGSTDASVLWASRTAYFHDLGMM